MKQIKLAEKQNSQESDSNSELENPKTEALNSDRPTSTTGLQKSVIELNENVKTLNENIMNIHNTNFILFAVEICILVVITVFLSFTVKLLKENLNRLERIEESQKSSTRDLIASIKSSPDNKGS